MKKLFFVLFMFSASFSLTLQPLKTSILEETFQTLIIIKALNALGYKTNEPKELSVPIMLETLLKNKDSKDIYFIGDFWLPLQEEMMQRVGKENFFLKGTYVRSCAQGYLIDKKTATKYGIKYLEDLQDPKIARLFDIDGDNKADLIGCNPGWGCERTINHQIKAFNLSKTVRHVQGEYSALISQILTRYKQNKPILYYTWTPYWLSAKLVPNKDVVWLEVKHSSHPVLKSTKLSNGKDYGFPVNNQYIIANKIVEKYPDIARLFEILRLNVSDIAAENMLIELGQKSAKDIDNHANNWIKANQKLFDSWIKEAKKYKKD